MAPLSRQAGFTLIEVMISIMLMAIISLISWRAIDSVTRTSEHLDQATRTATAIVHAFDQFDRDIAWRTTIEVSRRHIANDSGAPSKQEQLLPDSIMVQRRSQAPLRMEVVRTASSTPGSWQRVQWWRAGTTLYRSAGIAAPDYPLPAPSASTAVAVLDGVIDFDVRAWQPGAGWMRLPPAGPAPAALALEITITQGSLSQPLRYRRVVQLQ